MRLRKLVLPAFLIVVLHACISVETTAPPPVDAGADAPDCDSGVPCLVWSPNAPGPGCEFHAAPDGTPCDDGAGTCVSGACAH